MRYVILIATVVATVFGSTELAGVHYTATGLAGTATTYVIGFEDREIVDAFRKGDAERLNRFFHRWELQSGEISGAELELSGKEVKTIYELFEVFYCEHISRLEKQMAEQQAAQAKSQSKSRESSQSKAAERQEYLVIQNDIRFVVLDNNDYESRKRKIEFVGSGILELRNFRPRISSKTGRKVLYLDKTYERALNYFFNETDGDSFTCWDFDEHKEMFLSEKMLLYHRHWGRGYHYISFPQVYIVIFNSAMDKAYIPMYRDQWNGGGSVEYQKQDGAWKMAGRGIRSSWIE